MKYEFLIRRDAPRLVMLFAGWGMDAEPFRSLTVAGGYDLVVIWDYRNLMSEIPTDGYKEICVLAWSYGVSMASLWLDSHRELPVTRRIAVCGTLYPVDENRGIPEGIFTATLQGLNEATLLKFYQRMMGGRRAFEAFRRVMPCRGIDELKDELECIARYASGSEREKNLTEWDTVYVAESDYIIPTANQLSAWEGHPDLRVVEGSHFPEFEKLLDLPVCKENVSRSFAESQATYEENATVQHDIAAHLLKLWKEFGWLGGRGDVIEIGAGTGMLTRMYLDEVTPRSLTLMDIASLPEDIEAEKRICDAEVEIMALGECTADVIVTASTVQWFNSLGRFLEECGRVLRPGGIIALSTFGPATYREINHLVSARVSYISEESLRRIVPSGLEILRLEEDTIMLDFKTPRDLITHMRLTGVRGSGRKEEARLAGALGIMRENITFLTYNPVYILLRKSI